MVDCEKTPGPHAWCVRVCMSALKPSRKKENAWKTPSTRAYDWRGHYYLILVNRHHRHPRSPPHRYPVRLSRDQQD